MAVADLGAAKFVQTNWMRLRTGSVEDSAVVSEVAGSRLATLASLRFVGHMF